MSLVLYIVLLSLATLGSKLLLGLVVIYFLLPDDRVCSACNGETVPLRLRAGWRWLATILRLQHRWCPRCGGHTLARARHAGRVWVGSAEDAPVEDVGERMPPERS